MANKRLAGSVKINGVAYLLRREEDGTLVYNRRSTPKAQLNSGRRGSASGEANLLEYTWGCEDGYGDAVQTKDRDLYHYGMNFYMGHEGEAVVLPGAQVVRPSNATNVLEMNNPPVGVFEIAGDSPEQLSTYIVQDCRLWQLPSDELSSSADHVAFQEIVATFEADTMPSDTAQFGNVGYIGMGGALARTRFNSVANSGGDPRFATAVAHNLAVNDLVIIGSSTQTAYNGIWLVTTVSDSTHFDVAALTYTALSPDVPVTGVVAKLSNRYLRRFRDGALSKDDNTYKSITAVADNGSGKARFSVASHGYSVGDYIYLVNMTVAAYNSSSTGGTSTLYQITAVPTAGTFDVEAITFTSNGTGLVNRQDSDVFAEHIAIVGDLMVIAYEDINDGWVVSRVDAVDSNVMLSVNYTAGIQAGPKPVGDNDSPITDIVAVGGSGELVTTASGAFVYDTELSTYLNEIPELEQHPHPRNGLGSFEWKGWVYIPTSIGMFRWRNGQVQNVTPGRFGQQNFTSPVTIGRLTGDTEYLYGITEPFKVYQPKTVAGAQTAIYVDYDNAGTAFGSPDYSLDPTYDLNTITAAGYIYLGSTQPWHRMFVEMDAINNTLAANNSDLYIDAAQYWNGSTWTTRSELSDFTRTRKTSSRYSSSFGRSGDLVFKSAMPSDWVAGGTVPAGSLSSSFYWCRFSLSAVISNSTIIKRTIAGIHHGNSVFNAFPSSLDLAVEAGLAQFVVCAREEPGRGLVWNTLWGWMQHETTSASEPASRSDYNTGGAQPVGAMAVIQPNRFRAGLTGSRWLFVGGHNNNYVCPLGHAPDPTEDGPYMQVHEGEDRRAVLVFPDTDMGLPYVTKTLQEIRMEVEGITTATDLQIFYRADFGAWTSVGTVNSLPFEFTAGSEPSGLTFGIAVVVNLSTAKYVRLPRIDLPSLRGYVRPEMSEFITMTLELNSENRLPGQLDRRTSNTSYATLKALQSQTTSVAYVDIDESTDNVHVMQVAKRAIHNEDNRPVVLADVILSVVP